MIGDKSYVHFSEIIIVKVKRLCIYRNKSATLLYSNDVIGPTHFGHSSKSDITFDSGHEIIG